MTLIAVGGVAVELGATPMFRDVSFTVGARERWGVVGRNGSGKTTLFRLLTGELAPTRGTVVLRPGLRVTLLEQHRDFGGATTVWEAAAGRFADLLALERSLAEQSARLGTLGANATEQDLERYARDLERFEHEDGYALAARVDAVLHGLGFDPDAARGRTVESLSGGERGRLGLARQLVAPADVLLLDEPTNHLDLETTAWLEEYLQGTDAAVLLISHDRDLLDRVADHVLHVEGGTATPYVGGYSAFARQRAERRLAQQRAVEQQRRAIAHEEDYIRRNIAGQNSRQAKGRRTRLERLPRLSPPPGEAGAMALRLAPAERGGDQVVVAEGLRLAVGDRVLLDRFDTVVRRGDVIGLVGANGAGKTTLLRVLAGDGAPTGGTARLGGGITAAFYRQDLSQLAPQRALYDVIADERPTWGRGAVLGHLARFDFSGDDVARRVESLSGGERARLALALIALSRANLLLLDEPTNHLDVESIEVLEDALEVYEGTVILVSHDRAFLRELTTRVWSLHDGRISDFDGGFAEWEVAAAAAADAAARAAATAAEVRRAREREQDRASGSRRRDEDAARRQAARATAAAEDEVARLDARVAELTEELEDPALYLSAEGRARASQLDAELREARRAWEEAFERWSAVTSGER